LPVSTKEEVILPGARLDKEYPSGTPEQKEFWNYWENWWRKYWDNVEALFYRTIGHAEKAFKVNMYISIIIVVVGIVLLAYSIVYSWINGLDLYSTAFGALGVANFVAVFYLTPQRKIQSTVADLTQIQILYRGYSVQLGAANDWQRSHVTMGLEDLDKWCKQLESLSINAAQKIEELIGKD